MATARPAEASNPSIVAPFFIHLERGVWDAVFLFFSSFFFQNVVTCIGPVGVFETKPNVHCVVINQSQAGWLERATDNVMAPQNKTLSLQQEAIPLSCRTFGSSYSGLTLDLCD
jgi:hypothetical protein